MGDVEPTFRLVCMMGLPRSGKSTAARKLSRILGAPIVNRDSIRLALHGQRYQKLAEPTVGRKRSVSSAPAVGGASHGPIA